MGRNKTMIGEAELALAIAERESLSTRGHKYDDV